MPEALCNGGRYTMTTHEPAAEPLPTILPEPREIALLGGAAQLSEDVRLMTRDVAPLFRKSMRTILGAAGIRVVANKKKFIIDVQVLAAEDLDLRRVPAGLVEEYYELELRDNTVKILTGGQAGALWGTHTLAELYQTGVAHGELPNLKIRDWPSFSDRGIFVENKWGPDRMAKDEWFGLVDRLASAKMNRLGIGLYGCWGCQYEGKVTEFLGVAVPDHPELQTEKTLRWYSPKEGQWCEDTYLPTLSGEEDVLAEVVAYAKEKGVTIVPFLNSLGHNTLIPRLVPSVSAKSADGEPTGSGFCLSCPETREFLEAFYGSVIERGFPEGIDLFHIQMDEVYPTRCDVADPSRPVDPWCQCPECSGRSQEEGLQEYILWLVGMLTAKGVGRVVMWNDQLTRHMDVLNDDFLARLTDAGLADKLVLHWWWYSNDKLSDGVHVALGKKLGLPGWVAPMTCYFNWSRYGSRLPNIEMMMEMGHAEGAEGAMSYAVHDPAWADHEELLGEYAWNFRGGGPLHRGLRSWAERVFGSKAGEYLAGRAALDAATGSCPALDRCYYYPYTYFREGRPFPHHYPAEPLAALEELALEDAAPQLESAVVAGKMALEAFRECADADGVRDKDCAESLCGEAARVSGLAGAFLQLLTVKQEVAGGDATAAAVQACADARAALLEGMAVVEETKPKWVAPACLRDLSVLLEFLDQLAGDLDEVKGGGRDAADVRWYVEEPVNQQGWPKS